MRIRTLLSARALDRKTEKNPYFRDVDQMESRETTSIASQYHGYIENGRRYQNVKSEQYFMPPGERSLDF